MDVELPGLSARDVQMYYEDGTLHLFAERDKAFCLPDLHRTYSGSLRVGPQSVSDPSFALSSSDFIIGWAAGLWYV